MTPDDLFDYATSFSCRSVGAGQGARYPTFSQAAKRFKVSLGAVEEACENFVGNGYMKPATGLRVGSGVKRIQSRGNWLVEAYK